MKKKLMIFFLSIFSLNVYAQQSASHETLKQRIKDKITPNLVAKTKLTSTQADKVLDIIFDSERQRLMVEMDKSTNADNKMQKQQNIAAATLQQMQNVPLTSDQIKMVNLFFDEMKRKSSKPLGIQKTVTGKSDSLRQCRQALRQTIAGKGIYLLCPLKECLYLQYPFEGCFASLS